ncbi:hypothetical protein ACFU6K_33615, partial [Kitasatospora sp. NPDC057512]
AGAVAFAPTGGPRHGDGHVAEVDACLRLRDNRARGSVTSDDVSPARAVTLVRAVFDAVTALLRPPVAPDPTCAPARLDGRGPGGLRSSGRRPDCVR